jgi:hypothetical protein
MCKSIFLKFVYLFFFLLKMDVATTTNKDILVEGQFYEDNIFYTKESTCDYALSGQQKIDKADSHVYSK